MSVEDEESLRLTRKEIKELKEKEYIENFVQFEQKREDIIKKSVEANILNNKFDLFEA